MHLHPSKILPPSKQKYLMMQNTVVPSCPPKASGHCLSRLGQYFESLTRFPLTPPPFVNPSCGLTPAVWGVHGHSCGPLEYVPQRTPDLERTDTDRISKTLGALGLWPFLFTRLSRLSSFGSSSVLYKRISQRLFLARPKGHEGSLEQSIEATVDARRERLARRLNSGADFIRAIIGNPFARLPS